MRRLFIGHAAQLVGTLPHFLDMPHQRHAQGFEFIDFLLLPVNSLIERIYQVFLTRQFDFNLDQSVFCHCERSVEHAAFRHASSINRQCRCAAGSGAGQSRRQRFFDLDRVSAARALRLAHGLFGALDHGFGRIAKGIGSNATGKSQF